MTKLEKARAEYIQAHIDLEQSIEECDTARDEREQAKINRLQDWAKYDQAWDKYDRAYHKYNRDSYAHYLAEKKLIQLEVENILATKISI